MTAVMAGAATADSRAAYTLPMLLEAVRDGQASTQARRLLGAWLRDGAQRVDRDRDGTYGHQAAIALFDTWWESGRASVAKDVLRGRLGKLVQQLPQGIDDHPRQGIGSAFNGDRLVRLRQQGPAQLRSASRSKGAYHRVYCGNGKKKRCRNALANSLQQGDQARPAPPRAWPSRAP